MRIPELSVLVGTLRQHKSTKTLDKGAEDGALFFVGGIFLVCMVLAGCGGSQNPPNAMQKENIKSEHVVDASEVPNLYKCLSQLTADLRSQPDSTAVNLHCPAGTYQGETPEGRMCSMRVDENLPGMQFQIERDSFAIRLETVAYRGDGSAVHNMEDASASRQQGVQLTRFSGTQSPVTEAMILRVGAGSSALPQMIYMRTQGGTTKVMQCIYGK